MQGPVGMPRLKEPKTKYDDSIIAKQWSKEYGVFFPLRRTGSQSTRSSTKLGKNHNANLRTLGVLYPLLVGIQMVVLGIG